MASSKTLMIGALAIAVLLLISSHVSARELAESQTSGDVNVDHYRGNDRGYGYRKRYGHGHGNGNGYGHRYGNRHGHYGKPGDGGHPAAADETQVQN